MCKIAKVVKPQDFVIFTAKSMDMIQRIQTIYLLLTALLGAFLGFYNPHLWRAKLVNNTYNYFSGQSDYKYFVLTMIVILLAFVAIFLFKKRRLQFRLTLLNFFLCLGLIAVQYLLIRQMETELVTRQMLDTATYLPAAFLPVPMVILLFLAARNIHKDEKLIKSLDRLR